MAEALLRVRGLKKTFGNGKIRVRAVDDVTFDIQRGETFGLVGESGCGKSTTGRTIMRLYEPTAGDIHFDGQNVNGIKGPELKRLRRRMQMIFQDPYASLNPRLTVGEIIAEGMDIHQLATGSVRKQRIAEALRTVGLSDEMAGRFPHEFSGGQRQRIGIARALALEPEFIVADEPISALDVSIQAQIVNLLQQLQKERGLTYLFIAHDLAMVKHLSDRIGVMYLGAMMEIGPSADVYACPLHPYTQALLSAIPVADPDREQSRQRMVLRGDIPSPVNPPSGCRFRTRCPFATEECAKSRPELREVQPGRFVACHLVKAE